MRGLILAVKKIPFIEIVFLLLISLIPLLWYQPGSLLLGHDAGWSLDPIGRFLDRLSTWTRAGFGYDQSLDVGTLTIYSLQAFLSFTGLSIFWVQKITFIFWFFVMGSSMYYLSRSLYQGKNSRLVALLASTFYVLNHYTLQAWTVAELSKFSAMTIFPLVLAFLWQVIDKRMTLKKGAFLTGLFFFIFNGGGGSGIPLYGGMIISLVLLFLYKWLVEKYSFFRLVRIYAAFLIVIFLINAYWIVPLINVVFSQYSPFAQTGGPERVVGWTDLISRNTSFINLFRLQGFSSWYDNPVHPYASVFLDNPFFIILSFVFPLFSFLAIFFTKKKQDRRVVLFFSLLALLAIFFTAGTHPPLGFIYKWLMTHIYGFAIFKTAFYKFGYALWFSYAFLFAFSAAHLITLLKKKAFQFPALGVLVIFLSLYNFPFFTGIFFNFNEPFTTIVKLPQYILEARGYVRSLPEDSRILLIPPPSPVDGQTDIYSFGYFSRTPLPWQITQKSIVTNVETNIAGQERLTEELYGSILENDEDKVKKLISLLGLTHILVRSDVMLELPKYVITPPQEFMNSLSSYSWLLKDKTFGGWEFYKVDIATSQLSPYSANVHLVFGVDKDSFPPEIKLESVDKEIMVPEAYREFVPYISTKTIVARCVTCRILDKEYLPEVQVRFLPSSPFYILTKLREKDNFRKTNNDDFLYLRFLLIYTKKRALELSALTGEEEPFRREGLDEQKRSKLFREYEAQLAEIPQRYERLSEMQKLEILPGVIESLEIQKGLVRGIHSSPFLRDVEEEYFSLFDLLDALINSRIFQDRLSHQEAYHTLSLQVPDEGSYSVAIQNIATSSGQIDGRQFFTNTPVLLNKGVHQIDIPLGERKSLLEEKDFVLDKSVTRIEVPLSFLEPMTRYFLSFDYHIQQESVLKVEVIDDYGERSLSQILPALSYWRHSEFSFRTRNYISAPYLLRFLSSAEASSPGSIQIQNVSLIKEESLPRVIASARDTHEEEASSLVLRAEFKNPYKYTLSLEHVTKPFILVFKQTFSPYWEAKFSDGTLISNHFPANFVFNGWYIDKPGSYSLELNFKLQKTYYLGMIVSGATFLALFSYLVIKRRENRDA